MRVEIDIAAQEVSFRRRQEADLPTLAALYVQLMASHDVHYTTQMAAEKLAKAIAAYRAQRWDEAESLFRSMPETKISKLYLERIEHFRTSPPPADWDGVFVFTTK